MLKRRILATLVGLGIAGGVGATGVEVPVVIVPKVVTTTVIPPVVTPPIAPPVVTPPPTTPTEPAIATGSGHFNYIVFGGVVVFFWAVICTAERAKNPNGWWAQYMCLPRSK